MLNCCHHVVSNRNNIFGISQQNFKYASVLQIEWLVKFLSEGSKDYQDQGVEEPLRVEILIKNQF